MSDTFTTGSDCVSDPDSGSILAPSPILLILTFLLGIVLDRVKRIEVLPRPWNFVVGSLSFVAGTTLFIGAIRSMHSASTGPSHGDDPPELITDGVFQYSQNPIYVGNCLQYVGVALLYNSVSALALLTPLVAYLDRVVHQEEAYLESRFGKEFESYRGNVRRWL
jgi:protein-S-isoprenylcysteine O-methyltransferase Ste14